MHNPLSAVLLIVLVGCASAGSPDQQRKPMKGLVAGGVGEAKPADDRVKAAFNAVRSQIQSQAGAGAANARLTPVTYASQVVAGTNYFVKIKVDSKPPTYIHARIYEDLQGKRSLAAIQTGHTASDPIEYFSSSA